MSVNTTTTANISTTAATTTTTTTAITAITTSYFICSVDKVSKSAILSFRKIIPLFKLNYSKWNQN